MLSLVLDCVRERYTSPRELRQAMTLILGAMMATGTEFEVSFELHLLLLNSDWFNQLSKKTERSDENGE